MRLNKLGQIVADEWRRSEDMRNEGVLDAFTVMPKSTVGRFTERSGVNHLHGIVCRVPSAVDDGSPRGYDLRVGMSSTSPYNADHESVGTTGTEAA